MAANGRNKEKTSLSKRNALPLLLGLLGAALVATTGLLLAQVPAGAKLVFDGVTVVDVENGKLLQAQRVVVVGNRIQAMGNGSVVPVPKGAQVVDARGKYLIPGLW